MSASTPAPPPSANNNNNNAASASNTSTTTHAAMSVSEQQLRIHQELTAVAYAHAPAFVDAVQSVATAETATNQCRKTSSTLQQQLSAFKLSAQKLQESGNSWKRQRQLAASSSASLSKISELLDAPHTIESCIRSGMFHEALVAMQHVRGLVAAEKEMRMRKKRGEVVASSSTIQQGQNQNQLPSRQNSSTLSSSSLDHTSTLRDESEATSSSSSGFDNSSSTPQILLQVAQQVDETIERLLTTFILSQLSGPLVPSNALKIVIFLQSLAKQQLQEFEANNTSENDDFDNVINENTKQQKQEADVNNNNSPENVSDSSSCGLSILATDPTALPELFLNLRSEFIANEMKDALSLVATMMMSQQNNNNSSSSNNNNNSSSSSSSSFSCLQKMLAVYKVHVSEAVATYKTCFIQQNNNENTSISGSSSSNNDQIQQQQQQFQLRDLLSRWSAVHTTKLISLFSIHVAHLTSGADISMLLEPVAQCGAALSKAGLDVTVILESILVKRAEELFLTSMEQASQSFVVALGAHRWRAVVEVGGGGTSNNNNGEDKKKNVTEDNNDNDKEEKTDENKKNSGEENKKEDDEEEDSGKFVPPPMSLLRFPPLAHSMNSFLAGCNDVRKCALRAIRPKCMHSVLALITTISTQLSDVRGSLLLEGPELESLRVMSKAFSGDFVNHVQKCTFKVFGKIEEDLEWKKEIAKNIEMLRNATS